LIEELYLKTTAQAPTSLLNRVLHDITDKTHHPTVKGRRIKFYYITQVGTVPPRFRIVSNHPDLVTAAYSRFLAGSIKKSFGMDGIPVKLSFVGR
jgi:GTP-binding protein